MARAVPIPYFPVPPREYSAQHQAEVMRAFSIYAQQINNTGVNVDYGVFLSTTSQTLSTGNTGQLVTFSTTSSAQNITLTTSTRLNVLRKGLYRVGGQFQFISSATGTHRMFTWIRKNGTDVANTSRVVTITGAAVAQPINVVHAIDLDAKDYVEWVWAGKNTTAAALSTNSDAGFTIPATPSVVSVVEQIQF